MRFGVVALYSQDQFFGYVKRGGIFGENALLGVSSAPTLRLNASARTSISITAPATATASATTAPADILP